MDVVSAARALIGDTLAFHLFFVLFGVGLPLIISGLEAYGIWKKKPRARALAHEWSKALVILFIAGAVSGTVVALQFGLLWPKFTEFSGQVVGLSFTLEGFAFLVEALFLSVYMLSWNKFKPLQHWLCSLPIILGSVGSAFAITTVNAWMNTPRGFELDGQGNPININTKEAIFNPAVTTEVTHSILAYFFATTLVLLMIYALIMWRKRPPAAALPRLKTLLAGLAAMAAIFGVLVGLAGHQSGQFLAKYEPAKLAAATGIHETQEGAPLLIGGIVDGDKVKYALEIPKFLSFLATGDFNGKITGLNEFKPEDRPPATVHYFFDGMVAIGIITTTLPLIYLALRKWRKKWAHAKLVLIALVACGPLGIIATELGWMLTEFGRQPYVIQGIMRTSEAATTSKSVVKFAYIFPIFYLILFVLTMLALKKGFHPRKVLVDEPS